MFVLRRITSEANEVNTCLGDNYHYVSKERNQQEFFRNYHVYLGNDADSAVDDDFKKSLENDVYAFIVEQNGKNIIPLFKLSSYFIMLSNGKTFDNLSFR